MALRFPGLKQWNLDIRQQGSHFERKTGIPE